MIRDSKQECRKLTATLQVCFLRLCVAFALPTELSLSPSIDFILQILSPSHQGECLCGSGLTDGIKPYPSGTLVKS